MLTLLICIIVATAKPVAAGEAPGTPMAPPQSAGWQTDLGVGMIFNPEFQGSDDYRMLPVPYFDVRYVDARGVRTFISVPQGVGQYLLRERLDNGSRFALSAALAPGFQNRDTDQFRGLETFGIGLEARLGAEYDTGPWSLQAGLAKAIIAGHEGMYGNISASYRFVLGRGTIAALGPSVRLGDDRYMAALYGVTPRESEASGINAFSASGGLESIGLQGFLSVPVSDKWRFTGVARFGRLLGDAGDSSLTIQPNQLFIVTALTRRF